MAQTSRRAVRSIAAAALLTLSPTLVGCGFDPQTNQVYQPAVGSNFRSSEVDVLNAVVVVGDSGAEGRLIASFVNNNQERPDAVTGISGARDNANLQVSFGSEIPIPPSGLVNLADEAPILVTGELVGGQLVTLRYTFSEAEAVTFQAVVVGEFGQFAGLGPGSGGSSSSGVEPGGIGEGGDGGTAPVESPSESLSESPSESPSASPSEG